MSIADIALRSVFWLSSSMQYLIGAAAIALASPTEAAPAPAPVVVDSQGNVARFYGIPIDVTRASLERLHLPVTTRYESAAEARDGDPSPIYTVTAANGIEVELIFEQDGKLYEARTRSPNALGPKQVGVGSTLANVKSAWPAGEFFFGFADGAYVTYATGTNVILRFNPDDMPPGAFNHDRPWDFPVPDGIKVRSMSISPHAIRVSASKAYKPLGLSRNSSTIEDGKRNVLYRLDVERLGPASVRLTWYQAGNLKFDRTIDVSEFPDLDIWGRNILHDADPVVVSFRYGNFKNCAVRDDDRDEVYVTLRGDTATLTPNPPEGLRLRQPSAPPKYVGNMMNSAAHGCRRTFDPLTGATGLEKAGKGESEPATR